MSLPHSGESSIPWDRPTRAQKSLFSTPDPGSNDRANNYLGNDTEMGKSGLSPDFVHRSSALLSPSHMRPFSSRTHLPTPQSPNNMGSYLAASRATPESPSPQSQSSHVMLPETIRSQHNFVPTDTHISSSSRQIITPESSPLRPLSTPITPDRIRALRTSTHSLNIDPPLKLAPPHQISSPSSAASLDASPRSRLSSPFMSRLNLTERNSMKSVSPLHSRPTSVPPESSLPHDVFNVEPTRISTPPLSPFDPPQNILGEDKARTQQEPSYLREADSRMPEYLKRAKRSLEESDPSANDTALEEREREIPGIGITVSPNKGRRLKLFQETSEESFEESLMAGGYGRYRTMDWLTHANNDLPDANPIPELEIPSEKELKKRKRLAAFRRADGLVSSKLRPVQIEGKGRLLLDTAAEEQMALTHLPPSKKRSARKKKGALKPMSKTRAEVDHGGPDWPDTEFPWSLRIQERVEATRAQEEERLRWIEKFLDRDSDEDEDSDGALTDAGSQIAEQRSIPGMGRGKTVPLGADPPHRRTYYPSDPADARAALLSKRSVRTLSLRKQRNRSEDDVDEILCICRGRDDGRELVQCDACKTWYHLHCIGIKSVADLGDEEDPWFCFACEDQPDSRTPTPELSSEPTFVPTDEEPSGKTHYDPPFFQSSLPDSPVPSWNAPKPPRTPPHERPLAGPSWVGGTSTPVYPTQHVHMHAAADVEEPYDFTSTPSRGLFATPNNGWSARANGLFSTPPKIAGQRGSARTGGLPVLPPFEESAGGAFPLTRYRNLLTYDESPIGRALPNERLRLPPTYRPSDSPSLKAAAIPRQSSNNSSFGLSAERRD